MEINMDSTIEYEVSTYDDAYWLVQRVYIDKLPIIARQIAKFESAGDVDTFDKYLKELRGSAIKPKKNVEETKKQSKWIDSGGKD